MKFINLSIYAALALFALIGCGSSDNDTKAEYEFTVTLENIYEDKEVSQTGQFNLPKETTAGPLLDGSEMTFSFKAKEGDKLSLAMMLVESNDYFIAPAVTGIDLFNNSTALSGDITSQIFLWDAGTEVNQEPGTGTDQPLRQSAANTGSADTNNLVRLAVDTFNVLPEINELLNISIAHDNEGYFTVTIKNISGSSAFTSPFAGLIYYIHSTDEFLFEKDKIATNGLEALAEDGDASTLQAALPATLSGTVSLRQATSPGAANSGQSYSFMFRASKGQKLSFSTMLVQSNDYFFATAPQGIDLFTGNTQISGDITDQIKLYDAGTEIDQEPGTGADQAPRQSGTNTGAEDDDNLIKEVNDTFNVLPSVSSLIKVSVENYDNNGFIVTIENTSSSFSSPIAPGVFVIHNTGTPIFNIGESAKANGLEELSEDGNASTMLTYFEANKGVKNILTPGIFALFQNNNPIFKDGENDLGLGLEALAEEGDPTTLATNTGGISEVFNTPDGASAAGPLTVGNKYKFTFKATKGDLLTFVSMYVNSNDLFYSFSSDGLALFDSNGKPITGDVTSSTIIYDAGTEKNQRPGAGLNQPLSQSSVNQGDTDGGVIQEVNDGFSYPATNQLIKITIEAN